MGTRPLPALIEHRKTVFSRNMTFIANRTGVNITECKERTPSPTKVTKKPTTYKSSSSSSSSSGGWDTSNKGKSNANEQETNLIDKINYNHQHQKTPKPEQLGLTNNVRNWMIYGGIFGTLLFVVLLKLVCDNKKYRKQLNDKNYIYGVSNNKNDIDDDDDDETDQE